MSPRNDNARNTTPTKPRPMATPNIPTATVGDVSENKRVARRNRTTMAAPSDAPRNVVREVAALVSMSGRTRTTQMSTHAPIATMTPSARTADARAPKRRFTNAAKPKASDTCDSRTSVSSVDADVESTERPNANPNGRQVAATVTSTVKDGRLIGEPATMPRPRRVRADHVHGDASDCATKP